MSKGARWPGEWQAICDSCGLQFPSSKLKKRWDGLMVCANDYEPRHPQELLRIRPEKITPPWVRPAAADEFVHVCNIWDSSPYADMGTADCAHADVGSPDLSFEFLYRVWLESKRDEFTSITTDDGGYADDYADDYA